MKIGDTIYAVVKPDGKLPTYFQTPLLFPDESEANRIARLYDGARVVAVRLVPVEEKTP